MKGFAGFPPGKTGFISIPNLFFSELMPTIDDLSELKLTVYCFWALQRQEGDYRYIRRSEIEQDTIFMKGLDVDKSSRQATLTTALERAVSRGTLLHVRLQMQGQADDIYFMNTPNGRNAVRAIEAGNWAPGDVHRPIQLIVERPNIYVLYENNIGTISPHIANQLRAAEDEYPESWIAEAIHLAVENNARSWRYIAAILERWHKEGKESDGFSKRHSSQHGASETDYSDLIES